MGMGRAVDDSYIRKATLVASDFVEVFLGLITEKNLDLSLLIFKNIKVSLMY